MFNKIFEAYPLVGWEDMPQQCAFPRLSRSGNSNDGEIRCCFLNS